MWGCAYSNVQEFIQHEYYTVTIISGTAFTIAVIKAMYLSVRMALLT